MNRGSIYFCIIILFAVLVLGFAGSAHVISLDEILEGHEIDNGKNYGYRCTAGAHRGASLDFKENTLAALLAADSSSKYAFIEFDVQYSKDRKIVVFHDKRMLRLFGSLRSIGSTNYDQLVKLTDGEIAAYDQVVGKLKKKLNIEIKSQGDIQEDERLVNEIINDVRSRGRERDVLISSISSDVVKYVSRVYPDIATGQIFWWTSSTFLPFDSLTRSLFEEIAETRADYVMLHVANLNNIDNLLEFKPENKTIVFWDFDDKMYVLHRDLSDRLWGESVVISFLKSVKYKFSSLVSSVY